jgi:hypothetical protein
MAGSGAGLWIGETGSDQQPGRLLSQGEPGNPVTFTAADPGAPWHVLAIVNQHDSSVIRHTIIEDGGNSSWTAALHIDDASNQSVVLDTVTVQRSFDNNGIVVWSPTWVHGLSALDNGLSGLLLQGGTHTINGSRFERNGNAGIRVDGGSGHTVVQSILVDNVSWGLLNNTGDQITAISNWWGSDTGPYHDPTNLSGLGNPVSNNVTFNPWLNTPPSVP